MAKKLKKCPKCGGRIKEINLDKGGYRKVYSDGISRVVKKKYRCTKCGYESN